MCYGGVGVGGVVNVVQCSDVVQMILTGFRGGSTRRIPVFRNEFEGVVTVSVVAGALLAITLALSKVDVGRAARPGSTSKMERVGYWVLTL